MAASMSSKTENEFYKILFERCSYEIVSSKFGGIGDFEFEVRCDLNSEDRWENWKIHFEAISHVHWIVSSKTKQCTSERAKFIFKKDYVCQHASLNKKETSFRNKECSAALHVRIKKNNKYTRCRDEYVKRNLCTLIQVSFRHTHRCDVAEAWNCLRPIDSLKEVFINYFRSGMSPAEALSHHKNSVITDGVELLSDSSLNPPARWVYNVHQTWREREFGTATRSNNFFSTGEEIEKPNLNAERHGDNLPQMEHSQSSWDMSENEINNTENSVNVCNIKVNDEQTDNLIEGFCQKIKNILHKNTDNNYLMKCLRKFMQNNENVNDASILLNFFESNKKFNYKSRRLIKVKPNSISRRKEGRRRGAKRLSSGRPLKALVSKTKHKKQKRCLSAAVAMNVPNAKSHDSNH